MEILLPQLTALFQSFLWPMIRISAFFLTAPFFGASAVNLRVKIALAVAVTWLILPMVETPSVDPFSFNAVGLIAKEGAIGMLNGSARAEVRRRVVQPQLNIVMAHVALLRTRAVAHVDEDVVPGSILGRSRADDLFVPLI